MDMLPVGPECGGFGNIFLAGTSEHFLGQLPVGFEFLKNGVIGIHGFRSGFIHGGFDTRPLCLC